jgi:hypothetical protein
LEELYLDINKIDDKILTYMKDMKFEKLKVLSLRQNYLTNYGVFEEVKVFENLKKLDISSNRFKNKEFFENKIKQKKIDLNNIEELILSNGVFDEDSINNISALNLEKIKSLDLSCNNLSSLEFILNLNLPELENLILNENDISELKDLKTKFNNTQKNLIIMLENNMIKDEKEIDELIQNENITIKYKLNNAIIDDNNNDYDQNNTSTGVSY